MLPFLYELHRFLIALKTRGERLRPMLALHVAQE